jgi:hypothetical protein
LPPCSGCSAVLLILSNPIVSAETATVTVTARYSAGREVVGYETVRFTLVGRGNAWRVLKAEQLGVTSFVRCGPRDLRRQ